MGFLAVAARPRSRCGPGRNHLVGKIQVVKRRINVNHKNLLIVIALALILSACSLPLPPGSGDDATPTPVANTPNPEPTTESGQYNQKCPTDAEMWEAIGLTDVKPVFTGEGIPWDSCKWNWQAYNRDESITLELQDQWQATVTLVSGEVLVYKNNVDINEVAGFTLRYVPAYDQNHWVNNDCALLAQEYAFGQRRDPAYVTVSGNLSCNSPAPQSHVCPTTTTQVAALIGGDPDQWTAPDWELGAWVFKASEGQYVVLQVPASLKGASDVVRLDYWNGQKNMADSFLPGDKGIGLNEASFHCHAEE